MKIHIEQFLTNDQFYVKITKSENFLNDVWGDLKRYLTNYEKDSIIEENKDSIITEWICLLSVLKELKDLKDYKNFEITYSDIAKEKIKETIKNSNLITSTDFKYEFSQKDIDNLKKYGFNKIKLNKYQIRDLKDFFNYLMEQIFQYKDLGRQL